MARSSGVAGVVGPPLGVAGQVVGIGPGTEAAPGTGHDDDTGGRVIGGPLEQGPVLGIHARGPRVELLGAAEGDGGHPIGYLVGGDLEPVHPFTRSLVALAIR